jgi:hypothetical protein
VGHLREVTTMIDFRTAAPCCYQARGRRVTSIQNISGVL